MKSIVTALLLLGASPAFSADGGTAPIEIFGVRLSAELPVKECPVIEDEYTKKYNKGAPTKYIYSSAGRFNQICYDRLDNIGSPKPLENEIVSIRYPFSQRPEISARIYLAARVIANKVERIWFWTAGVGTQEHDLSVISQKFGEPSSLNRVKATNMLGAEFDLIEATWSLPGGVTATFNSYDGEIDKGLFVIATPVGEAAHESATKSTSNPTKF